MKCISKAMIPSDSVFFLNLPCDYNNKKLALKKNLGWEKPQKGNSKSQMPLKQLPQVPRWGKLSVDAQLPARPVSEDAHRAFLTPPPAQFPVVPEGTLLGADIHSGKGTASQQLSQNVPEVSCLGREPSVSPDPYYFPGL